MSDKSISLETLPILKFFIALSICLSEVGEILKHLKILIFLN